MDLHETAVKSLTRARDVVLKDLAALPEEAFTKKFGEKVRTVADIIYEIIQVNDHFGADIRGENPAPWSFNGWVYAPEDFTNKAAIMDAFKASADRLIATAEGYSSEELDVIIKNDMGEQSRYQGLNFLSLHMWYHSGQFNYIQTLLGDDGWHWGD